MTRLLTAIALSLALCGASFAQTITQTLIVTPKHPYVMVFATWLPFDSASGAQWVTNLPPARCAVLLAQIRTNPLAASAQCINGLPTGDPTPQLGLYQWP